MHVTRDSQKLRGGSERNMRGKKKLLVKFIAVTSSLLFGLHYAFHLPTFSLLFPPFFL
jgi:hypothetical protein